MTRPFPALRPLPLLAAGLALAGLAACERPASDAVGPPPLSAAEADAWTYAPEVEALPAGEPAPIGAYEPDEAYAWAERAHYMNYAFDESRPDYVYDHGGVDLWAWEAAGWFLVIEPLLSGDRYYYYRPNEPWPFYVMEDGYGYGFDDGRLVVAYDPSGRVMPPSFVTQRAGWGGRYLRRGRELRAARERAERRAVDEARWERRRARIEAQQARLERAAGEQPAWREFRRRAEVADAEVRRPLRAERERRRAVREARQEARQEVREEVRREARVEARRDARVEARREAREAAPPRRDTAPGAAKRNPKADEAHARNEARKAAREEEKRLKREAKEAEREAR